MSDSLTDPVLLWSTAVVLGYPLLALLLVELQRALRLSQPAVASLCNLLQVSVLPLTAIYILVSRVALMATDAAMFKLLLSVLAISVINALLFALNVVMRSGAFSGDWVQRTPALMLDLVRLFLVLVASAFVASEIWEVDLGGLLAALGVGSVVLGLALQDTLSGLFAGVSLMSGRHFKEGDWIEFGEASGRIVRMDWRSVTVETLDDNHLIVIPNSELSKAKFTVLSSATRVFGQNIHVAFSYGSPPARVMAAIEKAVLSVDCILRDPVHDIDLMEVGDKGMVYEVTIHTHDREVGEQATTEFLSKLWYICAREGLTQAGAANLRYQDNSLPTLPASEIAAALQGTGVFLSGAQDFGTLAAQAKPELYDTDELLLQVGQAFNRLFLVVSGRLSASQGSGEARHVLQHYGPGEFFVSRSFLTNVPASVDLRADCETRVIALTNASVIQFLNVNPTLARAFELTIDVSESGLAHASTATP